MQALVLSYVLLERGSSGVSKGRAFLRACTTRVLILFEVCVFHACAEILFEVCVFHACADPLRGVRVPRVC